MNQRFFKYNILKFVQIRLHSLTISLILFLVIILLLLSCTSKIENVNDPIVAKIGNEVITVSDFRVNYEFGLPYLKRKLDRKRSYLDYMIKEKILSLEGYHLGLDKSERVQKLENELFEELLVEELFTKEVHEKIKITSDQIREAINKSKVSWKLRYWVEPNADYANSVCQAMRQRGYSDVVDEILHYNAEVNLKPKDFETQYLTWLEVPSELLDAIKDLPLGEISDPIEMNGVYFIFQIVDIRQEGVLDSEYNSKAERYRQILFYRKVAEETQRYIAEFMTPKNVITKGDAFMDVADALAEWKQMDEKGRPDFINVVEAADENHPALLTLKNNLQKTMVTFKNGKWTINDLLKRFNLMSVKVDTKDQNQFRSQLNQQIAIEIRDFFMVKEAKQKKLYKSNSVKRQIKEWRDKWVYEEARSYYTKDLKITEEQARNYFEKFKDKYKIRKDNVPTFSSFQSQAIRDAYFLKEQSIIQQKVDSLKAHYPVVLNETVLDTIKTIDSKKSRWMSLQVFKRSSNRMAVPIVDPAWGL